MNAVPIKAAVAIKTAVTTSKPTASEAMVLIQDENTERKSTPREDLEEAPWKECLPIAISKRCTTGRKYDPCMIGH